jgi:transcriptional regulator with XRE-family HTH domain
MCVMTNAQVPNLAARLVEARQAKGLTQKQVADLCGVTLRGYQGWEYGDRMPRGDALPALADALGRPVAWFFEVPGKPSSAGSGEVAAA